MTTAIETPLPEAGDHDIKGTTSSRSVAIPFTWQDQCFIFCCLMLGTCFFLPWVSEPEITPWSRLVSSESVTSSAGWILLFALDFVTLCSVSQPRVRPWFGIATALAANVAIANLAVVPDRAGYGAALARVFALGLVVLSANPALVKAGDFAMRRLNSQTAEVFTHWGTVLSSIQFSTQEFYARIEAEIKARQWPGVEFFRVKQSESGVLSHKREYLRVMRQRQVFDVCAASFGQDFFFTMREAEIKPQLTPVTLIILVLSLFLAFSFCLSTFGRIPGFIGFGTLLLGGVFLLFNVLRMGLTRVDGVLMRIPVLGPVYEVWFRRSTTYFQHDARLVFLKLMDDLIKEHVDEETSGKGITLLSCFEHQPILQGFYTTSSRSPKENK